MVTMPAAPIRRAPHRSGNGDLPTPSMCPKKSEKYPRTYFRTCHLAAAAQTRPLLDGYGWNNQNRTIFLWRQFCLPRLAIPNTSWRSRGLVVLQLQLKVGSWLLLVPPRRLVSGVTVGLEWIVRSA